MIITEKVLTNITCRNKFNYIEKGYICNIGDIIEVEIKDVPANSQLKVDVKCDVCDNQRKMRYQDYNNSYINGNYYACSTKCAKNKYKDTNIKKYGTENPAKLEINILKMKNTNLEKYGVECFSKTEDYVIKSKNTSFSKYGVEFASQSIKFREIVKNTRIINGLQIADIDLDKFKLYSSKVKCLTNKLKNELFENWNGYDYYDNEFIKDNFNLKYTDKLYPTIDHKISTFYGFNNDIPIIEIASLNNLCITKRSINSIKGRLTEEEFKILKFIP